MSLSIGIVGLPNVGKSTLFKAVTNKQVDIQNYPFTTIEPNVGVVAVPDERVEALFDFSKSAKKIYTTIDFIDIAGLVRGAAQGEGLGNKFLANIREVDAIAHVVRVFDDSGITHVHNKIDPVNDIEVIRTELELADLQTSEKRKAKNEKELPPLELLGDKKVIYVFNVSEEQLTQKWQPDEKLKSALRGAPWIVMCNKLELELTDLPIDDRRELMAEFGIQESGLDQLIKESYKTLGLVTFFTTGEDETRAWTAHEGDPIPKASRAIHTDFERLFIRADVINWKALLEAGSWANARTRGVLRTEGRDYIIQDGDVVEIRI
ncbi:MAG: redox-regulated ATPase YchF [Candidatus Yanofskybacteria bacterium]|nr:redox-regulated ATPase YchF [Candidatus Yanofskybacteria bacterium]